MKKSKGTRSSLNEVQRAIMRSSRLDGLKWDIKKLVIDRDNWKRRAIELREIIDRAFVPANRKTRKILNEADKSEQEAST